MISVVSRPMPPSRRNASRPARWVTTWKLIARRPLAMAKRGALASSHPTTMTTRARMKRGTKSPPGRGKRAPARAGDRNRVRAGSSLLLQHGEKARQRHLDPVGPVAELVAQLVEHLLELEELHEPGHVFERFEQPATERCRRVGGEESPARLALPLVELVALGGAPLRIAERAQHPGHVAQRRTFQAAFGEGPGRLALEVDDVPVVVGEQDLAEVIVAVMADFQRAAARRGAGIDERENFRFS